MISTWGQFQEEKIWGPGLPLPLVEVRLKSNKATAVWKGIWRNLRRQNPEVFVFEVFCPQLPILGGIVPSVCSVKLCKLYMGCTLVQLDTHYVEWLHSLGIWLHLFERRLVVEAHLRFIAIASWWQNHRSAFLSDGLRGAVSACWSGDGLQRATIWNNQMDLEMLWN